MPRTRIVRLLLLAIALTCAAATSTSTAAARTTKARRTVAPSCTVYGALVETLELGPLKGPGVTKLPNHHSICSWSGQRAGHYAFVIALQVAPSPAFLGKSLLAQARRQASAANAKKHGFGGYLTKNTRRGFYFEGAAYWEEEEADQETGSCSVEQGGTGAAIEPGQSAAHCAGQPGTEGDFATAYGSPRPNGEPLVIQISVACQQGEASSLGLLRLERIIFSGRR